MEYLFGKPVSLDQQIDKWIKELNHESRTITRSITQAERAQVGTKNQIRKMMREGGQDVNVRTLARSIVFSRKQVSKLYCTQAHLSSAIQTIRHHKVQLKMARTMKLCSDATRTMNQLISIPELRQTAINLSKEMFRAGMIEELMDDALASVDDTDEDQLEEDADQEVASVLEELMPKAISTSLKPKASAKPIVEDDLMTEMLRRAAA